MDIYVKAFPTIYLHGVCQKHGSKLELQFKEAKTYKTDISIGAQVTTVRCIDGGPPTDTDCTDAWEISVLAGGPVRVGE